ncbi:SAM-dependent methyltransferase [Streptomyces sp. NPDC001493]
MNRPHHPDADRPRITMRVDRAGSARISNLLAGGKDWYEADQHVARQLNAAAPQFSSTVLINSTHNHLTVRMLVRELRVRSILDLGAGLPTLRRGLPDTAASAQSAAPDTKVVQVDRDPMVEAHLRMCSAGRAGQNTSVLADLADIDAVLAHPAVEALKENDGPVGVLLHDVAPYLTNTVADRVIRSLQTWLPPGSAISLTHATRDLHPEVMGTAAEILRTAGLPYQPRTHGQIRALLEPWPLLPPGLVPTGRYHPGRPHAQLPDFHSGAYAAIAVHPRSTVTGHPEGHVQP